MRVGNVDRCEGESASNAGSHPSEAARVEAGTALRPRVDGIDFFDQVEVLFGAIPDGVLIQNDGRIVYANQSAAAILEQPDRADLLGTVALELYAESALPSVLARLQSAYFGRRTTPARHDVRLPGGGSKPVVVSCLLVPLAGAPMLIEILRDEGARDRAG